jgi:hypothetical protein
VKPHIKEKKRRKNAKKGVWPGSFIGFVMNAFENQKRQD